jgi:hypothetical protein
MREPSFLREKQGCDGRRRKYNPKRQARKPSKAMAVILIMKKPYPQMAQI